MLRGIGDWALELTRPRLVRALLRSNAAFREFLFTLPRRVPRGEEDMKLNAAQRARAAAVPPRAGPPRPRR